MSAENPADVIEAVALAIGKHRHGSQEAWDEDRRLARALHDAGLLADPADRDVKARLIAHRNVLRRMNRAEAEVARLRATVARVLALADRLDSPYSNPSVRYMSTRIREALDGAGEQHE